MTAMDDAARARSARFAAACALVAVEHLDHAGPHRAGQDPSERRECPACFVHIHVGGRAACPRCGDIAMHRRLEQALREVDARGAVGGPTGIPVPDLRVPPDPHERF